MDTSSKVHYPWQEARNRHWNLLLVCVVLPGSLALSLLLPRHTAVFTGTKLYSHHAFFQYGSDSVFDDTWLTYGTDYLLAIIMAVLCARIVNIEYTPSRELLQCASALLVGGFALSTLAGGICHHLLAHATNAWYWRLLWRVCVGSVAASGGALGVCGSELLPREFAAYRAPTYFWTAYGAFYLAVTWLGVFSMRNPACDLFLTGVSQSIPTIYMAGAALARASSPSAGNKADEWRTANILVCGSLCNALLLPGYDVLNYLQWRDGLCNVFLHTFLGISWSCQAWALYRYVQTIASLSDKDM